MREFLISHFRLELLAKCCRHVGFDGLNFQGHTCRGTGKLHLGNWPLKLFVEKVKAKLYWRHTLLRIIQVSKSADSPSSRLPYSFSAPYSLSVFSLRSAVSPHTESEWTVLRWQRRVFVASTTFMKYDRKAYCRKSYDLYNHSPGDWISYMPPFSFRIVLVFFLLFFYQAWWIFPSVMMNCLPFAAIWIWIIPGSRLFLFGVDLLQSN